MNQGLWGRALYKLADGTLLGFDVRACKTEAAVIKGLRFWAMPGKGAFSTTGETAFYYQFSFYLHIVFFPSRYTSAPVMFEAGRLLEIG